MQPALDHYLSLRAERSISIGSWDSNFAVQIHLFVRDAMELFQPFYFLFIGLLFMDTAFLLLYLSPHFLLLSCQSNSLTPKAWLISNLGGLLLPSRSVSNFVN